MHFLRICNRYFYLSIILFSSILLSHCDLQLLNKSTMAKTSDGTEICITPGCVAAASLLLNAIDFTQDPCEDFYKFACNKWVENNPIPEDMSKYSTMTEVVERVTKRMRTTLNKEKTKSLQKALKEFGGWPFLTPDWKAKDVDLTDIMGKLMKHYGLRSFLSLIINANQMNTTENILRIDQHVLPIGQRDYYLNDTRYGKFVKGYRDYIMDHIKYLSTDMGLSDDYFKKVDGDIDKMIKFERELANITVPNDERRNKTKQYNKWTLEKLDKSMKSIKWQKYLKAIVPDEVYKKLLSNDKYEVVVAEPNFMQQLDNLLVSTDKNVLINYVLWALVRDFAPFLDERFIDLNQDWMKVLVERNSKPPLWKRCVSITSSSVSLAAGALYAERYFKTSDKSEVFAMVKNLQQAFDDLLQNSDWMDKKTKQVATEKAHEMVTNLGYADFIMNSTTLDEYYDKLYFDNTSSLFDMKRLVMVWETEKDFKELLKSFDRHKFELSPAVVNAYYSQEKNSITFPAGVLQPPFFRGDFPKAVNYGSIGWIIGHEITHGFDDEGNQYDKFGNLKNWWTPETYEKFHDKAKCIIDQYNRYNVSDIEQHVNGKLTQGENIADNGGMKEAYETFCGSVKRSFQIRLLLADNHSPDQFRINGVLSNFKGFADAFGCNPGTRMNPIKKCTVW